MNTSYTHPPVRDRTHVQTNETNAPDAKKQRRSIHTPNLTDIKTSEELKHTIQLSIKENQETLKAFASSSDFKHQSLSVSKLLFKSSTLNQHTHTRSYSHDPIFEIPKNKKMAISTLNSLFRKTTAPFSSVEILLKKPSHSDSHSILLIYSKQFGLYYCDPSQTDTHNQVSSNGMDFLNLVEAAGYTNFTSKQLHSLTQEETFIHLSRHASYTTPVPASNKPILTKEHLNQIISKLNLNINSENPTENKTAIITLCKLCLASLEKIQTIGKTLLNRFLNSTNGNLKAHTETALIKAFQETPKIGLYLSASYMESETYNSETFESFFTQASSFQTNLFSSLNEIYRSNESLKIKKALLFLVHLTLSTTPSIREMGDALLKKVTNDNIPPKHNTNTPYPVTKLLYTHTPTALLFQFIEQKQDRLSSSGNYTDRYLISHLLQQLFLSNSSEQVETCKHYVSTIALSNDTRKGETFTHFINSIVHKNEARTIRLIKELATSDSIIVQKKAAYCISLLSFKDKLIEELSKADSQTKRSTLATYMFDVATKDQVQHKNKQQPSKSTYDTSLFQTFSNSNHPNQKETAKVYLKQLHQYNSGIEILQISHQEQLTKLLMSCIEKGPEFLDNIASELAI